MRTTDIRRTAFAVPIVIVVALLAGAAPAAARQMALGAVGSMSLDEHAASIGGHYPALWQISNKWGSDPPDNKFPTAAANALQAKGVTPLIRWTNTDPVDWNLGKYERYKRIINGFHDAYIRTWAQDAKAFGHTVVVRLMHEPNQPAFPWAVGRFDNTKRGFKRAWRHIFRIFQEEGADNVKFLWSMAKQACRRCNPYKAYYPGDAWVHYVGFSGFNWGTYHGRKWISMLKAFQQPMNRFKQFSKRPVIVAEAASNHRGGNKANWIRWGYPKIFRTWPRIKAIVYLDTIEPRKSFGHPDWRLLKPINGTALAAYEAIADQPRFQGTIP